MRKSSSCSWAALSTLYQYLPISFFHSSMLTPKQLLWSNSYIFLHSKSQQELVKVYPFGPWATCSVSYHTALCATEEQPLFQGWGTGDTTAWNEGDWSLTLPPQSQESLQVPMSFSFWWQLPHHPSQGEVPWVCVGRASQGTWNRQAKSDLEGKQQQCMGKKTSHRMIYRWSSSLQSPVGKVIPYAFQNTTPLPIIPAHQLLNCCWSCWKQYLLLLQAVGWQSSASAHQKSKEISILTKAGLIFILPQSKVTQHYSMQSSRQTSETITCNDTAKLII